MPKRKYNPDWVDNTRHERYKRREEALVAALRHAGWDGKSQFLTAIINGVIQPPTNPFVRSEAKMGEKQAKIGKLGG